MLLEISKTIWEPVIKNPRMYLMTDKGETAHGYAVRKNVESSGATIYGFFDERTVVYSTKDLY